MARECDVYGSEILPQQKHSMTAAEVKLNVITGLRMGTLKTSPDFQDIEQEPIEVSEYLAKRE